MTLEDKVAVVTGGSSGIGRAIATRFAEAGADVVVADQRLEPREGGPPTHQWIRTETNRKAVYVECNVADVADLETAVEAADAFGGVEVMVNSAGIGRAEPFLSISEADYDELLSINLKGTFFGAQIAARRMVENDGGCIINLSSTAGIRGSNNSAAYSASKGGVRLLTYSLAAELGPAGIRVNVLHPGVIETEMTRQDIPVIGGEKAARYMDRIPLKTFGDTSDVSEMAAFLASDRADFINGVSIVIDGGMVNAG